MKKLITLVALFALLITLGASCKKEEFAEKPLKYKMFGKWQIEKITTTVAGGQPSTVTYNTSSDYIDFKENDDDDFEQSLGGNRSIGTWSVRIDDSFQLAYSFEKLEAKLDNITPSALQFTGTVKTSNGANETRTYFLKR